MAEVVTMILGMGFTFLIVMVIFVFAAFAVHCLAKLMDWLGSLD